MNVQPTERVHIQYSTNMKEKALESSSADKQLQVHEILLTNGSGGSIDMSAVKRLAVTDRDIKKLDSGTITDVPDSSLDGETFFAANDDALIIGSRRKFGAVSLVVDNVDDGSGVYAYQYYNGSSWATLTTYDAPTAYNTLQTENILFPPPHDWALGGDTDDYDGDKYYIRVVSTTAPISVASFDAGEDFWVGTIMTYAPQIAANGQLALSISDPHYPFLFEAGQSIVPYFGTANAKNSLEVEFTLGG